ncbi:MAG: response regulator [Nitrospirota bacterium]|nr:response regulator [Nitrospirota bacterium]
MDQEIEKISVIVIDASAVTRYLLSEILEQTGDIKVVASVHDHAEALNQIQNLKPHVVTFDVAMPGMNGLTFLQKLMELHPTPVVIISAMTPYHKDSVVKAMELGAVAYVGKQTSQTWSGILGMADEIIAKIRSASTAQVQGSISADGQAAADNF